MSVKFTDEQQAVIDARKCNILVSAAAGSGKTAVLVERIIQMISSDMDIDHLLVVTFTKAAAAQMREKITLAIQDRLLKDPDNKHLQKQETLIHNAQITTIDSFCQYVLKNNFNAIGIDPSFHVGDDGEMRLLQDEVMAEMLEEEYRKADETEDSDFLYAMEYFGSGSSDKRVEEYILQLYRFSMSMPWPEDWINERALDYSYRETDFDELDFVVSCKEHVKRSIEEMLDRLLAAEKICCESDGPYMYGDTLEGDITGIEALLGRDNYDELFDALRTVSFGRLPVKKDDSVAPGKREYVQKLRNGVKDAIKELIEKYLPLPSGTILDQMALCDRAVKELCRLTLRYKELFDEKKREKRLIDFSDMEHFALQILVEHPSEEECLGLTAEQIIEKCRPSAVALEYRDYYKEVLIDEYQDSNNVQELILKSISGEIPDRSERFMVGDVKQSIYKFRLARPEIFMEKLDTYSKEKGAADHRIDLHRNFRSRRQVLEITNYIFEKIMGRDLGSVDYDQDARLVTGADYLAPKMEVSPELIMFEAASDETGALSSYDARQKEALVIAKRIHEIMRENPDLKYKDMVILLRSLSGWDDVFKQVLEDQGIPVYIESKSGYFDAGEIVTMLSLLTIVDNPSQDIPLVSVMHSCIGDFDDEELAKLRIFVDADEKASLEDSFYCGLKEIDKAWAEKDDLKAGAVDENFVNDDTRALIKKLHGFIAFIEELRVASVYTPVHELLQHIIAVTGFDTYCLAMPGGSQRKANLDQLLERALSFEKTSFKGLFHFVRYVENMKVIQVDYGEAGILDENADVVRIMSIHKSKGLEFPVVFVSGTTKGFNRMDTKKDLITDIDLGLGVKCIDLENRVKYDTLKRQIISDKMLTDNLGEELRVLYVALTRAKEKLIITASVKKLSETVAATLKDIPVLAAGTTAKNLLLPYSMRAGAGSYFDLILPSLIRHPSFEKALDKLELPKDEYLAGIDRSLPVRPLGEVCDKEDDTVYMPELAVDVLTEDEIISSLVKKDVSALARKQELLGESIAADEDLCKRLLIRFESKYAYENLKGLFTKTTVTELKKHMLEEMGETFDRQEDYGAEYEEEAEKEEKDQAVGEGPEKRIKKLTGAERGTAYHRIMEILDKDIYGDEEFMKAAADGGKADGSKEISKRIFKWMLGMKDKGFIPQEYLNCVYAPDIVTFLSTDLGQRMGRAYREGKLFREKPFMMGISARDLDPKFPSEEMVLIQGIIDAWFMEGDDIILMDYKTDKVKEASELIHRYQIQLDLYKRAIEATTGKKVKEIYIYSFGLGCQIKM